MRIAISGLFAAALATLPLSAANAQYYPYCSPFPLSWPFCVRAGAPVNTAATIATAPFYRGRRRAQCTIMGNPIITAREYYYYPTRRHHRRRHYY